MGAETAAKTLLTKAKDYVGIYQVKDNSVEAILFVVVNKYTTEIYKDPEKLAEAMREFGADEREIIKVQMMMRVHGFREVLEMDDRVQQVDIERYVQNALEETGFHAKQVLELTAAIVKSLGIMVMRDYRRTLQEGNESAGFVIPLSIYERELRQFESKFNENEPEKTDPIEVARIGVLAKAGIPRAKYYMGKLLLAQDDFSTKTPLGLAYLEQAAADCDPLAAAALGDYYYELEDSDSWNKAYDYYTGYGALALNQTRRERIVEILNSAKQNRKTILKGLILTLVLLVTVLITPAQTMFASYRGWGIAFLVLDVAILAVAILHHRAKPYDRLTWVPCATFVLWALFILIRVLF